MASLVGQQLKDTYDSLLKTSDNDALSGTYKEITDGSGNGSNLYLGTGGKVGIGTNSPSKDLTINSATGGQLQFEYNTGGYLRIEADSGGGSYYAAAGLYHRFFTSGTERMRINSSGQVGIGETNPTANLNIKSSSSTNSDNLGQVLTNSEFRLQYRSDDLSSLYIGGLGSERGYLQGVNNAQNAGADISLNPYGGNVGIGTNSPDAFTKLTVAGAMTLTGQNTGHGASRIKIGQDTTAISQIRFYGADASTAGILQFIGSSSDGTVGDERMRIDSDGKVGIGETNPTAPLQIKTATSAGNAKVAQFLTHADTTSGTEVRLAFAAHTNIDIASDRYSYISALNTSGSNGQALVFATNAAGAGGSEKMRIDSSGNVDIKTVGSETSPSLFFGGDGDTGFFKPLSNTLAFSTFGSERMRIASDGEVTIKGSNSSTHPALTLQNTHGASGSQGSTKLEFSVINSINTDVRSTIISRERTTDSNLSELLFSVSDNGSGNPALAFTLTGGASAGDATFLRMASGTGGIQFGGDTAEANALDDYEEGTFSPVIRGSGTAGTYELSSSLAYYTKVGRLVTLHMSLTLDDPITGGGSGYTQITGLPFAKANSFHTTAVVNSIGFDFTGDYLITRFTTAGTTSTVLGIFGSRDNASISTPSISGLSAGDSFTITVSYLT